MSAFDRAEAAADISFGAKMVVIAFWCIAAGAGLWVASWVTR